MPGENDDVPPGNGFVDPGRYGTYLIGMDVPHAPGAATHEGIPGADKGTGLVGIEADDDDVTISLRCARQLDPLCQVGIGVDDAIQQFGFDA